jgi:hypothetical protein
MSDHEPLNASPLPLIPRRRFLRDSALAAGAGAAATTLGLRPASAQVPVSTPVASAVAGTPALTPSETHILQAALNRIFPADDYGPNAVDCGVDVYIQQSLAGWLAAVAPLYSEGLAALDKAAGSGGFAALSEDKQDAILTSLEAGKLAGAPDGFWATLLEHARQGMFCDPIHGGNKNFAGWDLINYPGVKLVWTAEDQAEGTTVKPDHVSVAKFGGAA